MAVLPPFFHHFPKPFSQLFFRHFSTIFRSTATLTCFILLGKQNHSNTNQQGGDPAATIDVFFQEDFGEGGAGYEGEGGGSWSHQTGIAPGECSKQTKEPYRHAAQSHQEALFAEDPANYDQEAAAGAKLVQVADAFHGAGEQDIPGAGCQDDHADGAPNFKRV